MARVVLAAVLVAVVLVQPAAAAGTFAEPTTVLHTFQSSAGTGSFGFAVSELADVDGDRAREAIVSEPFADGGHVYVYSGRTGDELYRFDGAAGEWFGLAIADAGDTDRDRTSDVIVGAPRAGNGHAYLYSGASGELLHAFEGFAPGSFFGAAVSSAGDVDGDKRADVLVGAPRSNSGGALSGSAYVFSGRTYELLREIDLGDDGDLFGTGTDWTRDLNRDRVPDLIVGARNAGDEGRGRVYVFSGKIGLPLFQFDAPATGMEFGHFFVAGVGDVNRDGRPDVYVGDYGDETNGPGSGRAAVFSGRDGSELLRWTGGSGEGLTPGREAGDVNRDGRIDLAIGSYTAGPSGEGKLQVFSGRDGSVLRTITSTTPGENFGYDAVGLGDVNRDRRLDLLVSAATGDTVYVIAGTSLRGDDDDED